MYDNSIIEPKRFNIKTPYGIFDVESMRKPASSCNFTYKYKFKKLIYDNHKRPIYVVLSKVSTITGKPILGDEYLYIRQKTNLINKHLS